MTRKRAALAGFFAVLYPGLGHVYLREWFGALGWFVFAVGTAAFVIPTSVVSAFNTGGVVEFVQASGDLPAEALVALTVVRVLNVVDAVRIALGTDPHADGDEGPTCPNCGRGLDEDLDFCPWCSTFLGERPEALAEPSAPKRPPDGGGGSGGGGSGGGDRDGKR